MQIAELMKLIPDDGILSFQNNSGKLVIKITSHCVDGQKYQIEEEFLNPVDDEKILKSISKMQGHLIYRLKRESHANS